MEITLELRHDDDGPMAEVVDLDRLSPLARLLALAISQRMTPTPGIITIQSTATLHELVPGITDDPERAARWCTLGELAAPNRRAWDSWSDYPGDSTMDPHDYLEQQASRLPEGYLPVVTDEQIDTAAVLEMLASLGRPIAASTWRAYVARGQAPPPVRTYGRTPVWWRSQIEWWIDRRGRGRVSIST